MNLQTKITVAAPDFLIDYNSRLMMLGSCFAENMGSKFSYYKFDVDVNPCGIIYNPLSVANVLRLIVEGKQFETSRWQMGEFVSSRGFFFDRPG